MSAPVCFIDTETLGLDADHQPVWEVGLILPDGTEHVWQIMVAPRAISLAHPKALEIGRFEERYGVDREPDRAQDVARDLATYIPGGCHLAGAVVSFDEERLRRMLWMYGHPIPWHYHLIDVENLAVGFLHGRAKPSEWFQPPWDSAVISAAVGVAPDLFDKHTALGDARWAKAIYDAVAGH